MSARVATLLDPTWFSAIGGWATLTPSGLLIIGVMMLLLGLLIPRWVYMRIVKEVEYWRSVAEAKDKVIAKKDEALVKALGSLDAIQRVWDALLPEERRRARLIVAERGDDEGGDDDAVPMAAEPDLA